MNKSNIIKIINEEVTALIDAKLPKYIGQDIENQKKYLDNLKRLGILKNEMKKINPSLTIEINRNMGEYYLKDKITGDLIRSTPDGVYPINNISDEAFDEILTDFKTWATAYTNKTGFFKK